MMWISFRCKSGSEVDQFWMQFNTRHYEQIIKVIENSFDIV